MEILNIEGLEKVRLIIEFERYGISYIDCE